MTPDAPDPQQQPEGDPGLRLLRRVGASGLVLATVLALVVGAIGGSGRDGAAVFLLLSALTSSLLGLVGVITLARDDHRDLPISRARIIVTVAGFAGATLLMAMLVGVGG